MRLFRDTSYDRQAGRRVPAAKWTVEFTHGDTRRRIAVFADKGASEQFGRKVERLSALRSVGETPDPATNQWIAQLPRRIRDRLSAIGLLDRRSLELARPLTLAADDHQGSAPLLDDFEAALRARGNSPGHVAQTTSRVRAILEGCGFRLWSEIQPRRVEQFLFAGRAGTSDAPGISPRTSNYMLQAIRQFCGWMVTSGLATEDPLRSIRPLNCRADIRVRRRALSPDEVRRLLRVVELAPERDGMSGTERSLLYQLAVETGLRRSEIMSLQVSSFDLTGTDPTVSLKAAYSKRRRDDTLPLRYPLAAALKDFFASRPGAARAFGMKKSWNAATILQADLADAGVLARDGLGKVVTTDHDGRVVDFHALRHTFVTNLVIGGVQPKVAQALARHSTITLTLDRYTHLRVDDERKALQSLPDLGAAPASVLCNPAEVAQSAGAQPPACYSDGQPAIFSRRKAC